MKAFIVIGLLIVSVVKLSSEPMKSYKIVIDPGHGGMQQTPNEIYGDKFDTVSGRYLEPYKNGAGYKNRTEMEIVQGIANDVKNVLDLTKTEKGFKKFKSYVKLFSDEEPVWIRIDSVLSRTDNYKQRNYREKDDKNEPYRLYDFPDFATGKMKHGRLSFINSQKPIMVVSLHVNDMGKRKDLEKGGMGVVLTPSYKTFELLKKISDGKADASDFTKSPWHNWMIFEGKWSRLENAIADAWIYFHGYWPTQDGKKADLDRFEGYRYNMLAWKYRDKDGWESKALNKEGPYAFEHDKFRPTGKFWEREKSKLEMMRREGGIEGFGGDNNYAGMELLRFIQYGLRLQVKPDKDSYTEPGKIVKPFISTYSLPTLINAISAYLELGDIRSDKDIYFLTKKKRKTAVCIAVGIYSLVNGLEIKEQDFPYLPKGKRIEFEKYITKSGESYFQVVTEEKNK